MCGIAPLTQETYVRQVSMFARHFGRSAEALGAEEIRSYRVYLATEKELSPTSISIAVAALRFLYNENSVLRLKPHTILKTYYATA